MTKACKKGTPSMSFICSPSADYHQKNGNATCHKGRANLFSLEVIPFTHAMQAAIGKKIK